MRNAFVKSRVVAATIGAVGAAVIGLAGVAEAAPSGPADAEQTINRLQSQGYSVIVIRLGSSPLNKASVVSVRPGRTFPRTDTLSNVTERTVYVEVR